jgi:hypothetical protein
VPAEECKEWADDLRGKVNAVLVAAVKAVTGGR